MNHAEHFLSRLERLATREVDFALQLYRDTPLVRAVIDAAGVPDGAERVALSIDDPQQGPFLVLTRDGRFVTCLGRGMSPGRLPVITRGKLDSIACKISDLRERLALAARDGGRVGEKPSHKLLVRMLKGSHSLTREEFVEVARWEPLLHEACFDLYRYHCLELSRLAPHVARMSPGKKVHDAAIMNLGNLYYAVANLFVLATMSGRREVFEELIERAVAGSYPITWVLSLSALTPIMARVAWGIGRLGKMVLALFKKVLDVAPLPAIWYDAVLGLAALGRRTPALRAEVQKALRAAPFVGSTEAALLVRRDHHAAFVRFAELAAAGVALSEDECEARLVQAGQATLDSGQIGIAEGCALPPDHLRMLAILAPLDGYLTEAGAEKTLRVVLATARGGPEQLYRPAAMTLLGWPWCVDLADKMLRSTRVSLRGHGAPNQRPARPGPNEPCHCKSGNKYKRCCRDRDLQGRSEVLRPATPLSPETARERLARMQREEEERRAREQAAR